MKQTDLVIFNFSLNISILTHAFSVNAVDNRTFKPRKAKTVDVGEFMDFANTLTSQQRLAVYQFLSTGALWCMCCICV